MEEKQKIGLKTVRINDFRCLDEVTLDLEQIVALKGNNESGKTSIIKALELLMLGGSNAKKYIRSGCRDFRVAGYVEDLDTTVVRTSKGYKIYSGNVIDKSAEKKAEPTTIVDKLNGNETPEPVAKIFNTKRNSVTGGMLGSRGYNGIIPFVQTSPAENYSIVSEEMGVKPFRDAAYGGLLEAGRLEKKGKLLASQLADLNAQKVKAEELVGKAEDMEKVLGDRGSLYDAVISALESLATIEELTETVGEASVKEAPEPIDTLLLDAIDRVKKAAADLKSAKKAIESLGDLDKEAPSPIDETLVMAVASVKDSASKRKACKQTLEACDENLAKITAEIKQYGDEINICPVCGAVLVDGRCSE